MSYLQNPTSNKSTILKILSIIVGFIFVIGIATTSFYIEMRRELGECLKKIEKEEETPKGLSPFELEAIRKRDAQRKADLKIVQQALESYSNNRDGRHPYLLADSTTSLWRRNLKEALREYIAEIPIDPLNNEEYSYRFDGSLNNGRRYALSANLEDKTDPEGPHYVIYGGNPYP